jgi:hypothetical protein
MVPRRKKEPKTAEEGEEGKEGKEEKRCVLGGAYFLPATDRQQESQSLRSFCVLTLSIQYSRKQVRQDYERGLLR